MKTLDEVIKVFEAFSKECSDLYEGPSQSTVSDALYYLKAYKEMVDSFTGVVVQYKEIFKMIIDEAENENVG